MCYVLCFMYAISIKHGLNYHETDIQRYAELNTKYFVWKIICSTWIMFRVVKCRKGVKKEVWKENLKEEYRESMERVS